VPLEHLREGFRFGGRRVSFRSFQKGLHRSSAQRGPAALTLTTSFKNPYADAFHTAGGSFSYAYRAGAIDQADNRALRAEQSFRRQSSTFARRDAPDGHRFEATRALRQSLARAVEWALIRHQPAKTGVDSLQPPRREMRPFELAAGITPPDQPD
jgi:hypothetical protein